MQAHQQMHCTAQYMNKCPALHHHHHQSLKREGRWGTTDDFATSFLHFSLFSSITQHTNKCTAPHIDSDKRKKSHTKKYVSYTTAASWEKKNPLFPISLCSKHSSTALVQKKTHKKKHKKHTTNRSLSTPLTHICCPNQHCSHHY